MDSIKESDLYLFLNQDEIISIFIDGSIFPYMTANSIIDLFNKFGLKTITISKDGINLPRKVLMNKLFSSLHKNNKTIDFLNYFIIRKNIRESVNDIILDNNSNIFGILDNKYPEMSHIKRDSIENHKILADFLRKKFIDSINKELIYSDCKLSINNNTLFIENTNSINFENTSNMGKVINDLFLKNMMENAKKELDNGDFYTVVTKSRALIETTFIQILKRNNVSFNEKSGNLKKYRELVSKCLNMNIQKEWPKNVKVLVSGLNKIIDSISDMRNKNSDSHASLNRSPITRAEAELILSTSINVSHYYLDVEDRHKNKRR
ncbi:abortive infection family protein [Apilactobacillus xinyiensis]|uniref:abortive infection family protein n=1 Tax=Apilactobacillus xinyiensis TaxID=2841032 RepID=UPI001C7DE559|nr:abortive infection family protein [Apilactobacillus xinyiensis]